MHPEDRDGDAENTKREMPMKSTEENSTLTTSKMSAASDEISSESHKEKKTCSDDGAPSTQAAATLASSTTKTTRRTTTITTTTTTTTTTTSTASAALAASPSCAKKTIIAVSTLRLHAAITAGSVSSVEAIISQQASLLEARDRRRRTPLHTACMGSSVEVVQTLLRAGANVEAVDGAGYSPMHRAAQAGKLDFARALLGLENGVTCPADSDAPTVKGGYHPLHLACLAGSADMVELLVCVGANVGSTDNWKCTPLHRACLEGHLRAACAILDAGADVHTKDEWQSTPLHRACHSGRVKIVKLLLQRGASSTARDDQNERPGQSFDVIVSSEQQKAINALLEKARNDTSTGLVKQADLSAPWRRRTPGVEPSSTGQCKQSPNRYVPPGARKLQEQASKVAIPANNVLGSESSNKSAAVQPWRRKTKTLSGLSGERGPDVDGDATRFMDDVVVKEVGMVEPVLVAGCRDVVDAPAGTGFRGSFSGQTAAVGMGSGDKASTSGLSHVLNDVHTDVFSFGDDWGLSFDAPPQQSYLGTG